MSFSETMDADSVCIFGTHGTNPDRCALYTFDANRKETLITETEFRNHCAIACLNGELIRFCQKVFINTFELFYAYPIRLKASSI